MAIWGIDLNATAETLNLRGTSTDTHMCMNMHNHTWTYPWKCTDMGLPSGPGPFTFMSS